MSQATQAIESAALLLPRAERARLAERLLASLDTDPGIEKAWDEEIKRRLDAWEAGLVKEVPWEDVQAQARARLEAK